MKHKKWLIPFVILLFISMPILSGFLGTNIGTYYMKRDTRPNVQQAEEYADFFKLELFYYPSPDVVDERVHDYFDNAFFFRITEDTGKIALAMQNYLWYTEHEQLSAEEYESIVAYLAKEKCDAEHYFTEMEVGILPNKLLDLKELFPQEAQAYIKNNYENLSNIKVSSAKGK